MVISLTVSYATQHCLKKTIEGSYEYPHWHGLENEQIVSFKGAINPHHVLNQTLRCV